MANPDQEQRYMEKRYSVEVLFQEVNEISGKISEIKTLKELNKVLKGRLGKLREAFYGVVSRTLKPPAKQSAWLQFEVLSKDFDNYFERKEEERLQKEKKAEKE